MTKRVGDVVRIEPTAPAVCELCGKVAELRPYGPMGEHICFWCGQKNLTATNDAIGKLLDGADHATVFVLERVRKQ